MRHQYRPQNLAVAVCRRCGKRAYTSRRDARRAARALHPDVALRPYQCGDSWHVGHTPQWIKRGEAA